MKKKKEISNEEKFDKAFLGFIQVSFLCIQISLLIGTACLIKFALEYLRS